MPKIIAVDTCLFHILLTEVLVDAEHGDHTHFELITATITLDAGNESTGYTYTGGKGCFAIKAMIDDDLAPFRIGKSPEDIEMFKAVAPGDAGTALCMIGKSCLALIY